MTQVGEDSTARLSTTSSYLTGATDTTGTSSITKLMAFASQLGNDLKAAMRDVATGAANAERAVGNEVVVDQIAVEAKENGSGTAAVTAFEASAATSKHSLLQASAVDVMNSTRAADGGGDGDDGGEFWAFRATFLWSSFFAQPTDLKYNRNNNCTQSRASLDLLLYADMYKLIWLVFLQGFGAPYFCYHVPTHQ